MFTTDSGATPYTASLPDDNIKYVHERSTASTKRGNNPRAAGNVLMEEVASISHDQNQTPINHVSEEKKISQDVTDSVPTRPTISKIFIEKIPLNEVESSSTESESLTGSGDVNHKTASCCTVFCTLFQLKDVFTHYTIVDLSLNIGSLCLFIFDFVTDWVNAFHYFFRNEGDDLFYFWLTVIFIAVPSIIIHVFSLWWEADDYKQAKHKKKNRNLKTRLGCCYYTGVALFHVFQIAPVYRYCRTIYYGIKSRKKEKELDNTGHELYNNKFKKEISDVSFIRLIESYLESAPQLVLQLAIMIKTTRAPAITVLSVFVSLFGMSVSLVAYERALRNMLEEKEPLSAQASVVLFLYRTFTILSRVFALALLLNTNVWAWIGFFVIHWVVMSAAIAIRKTEFYKNSKWKEYIYDIVIGFCYNFDYINVHLAPNNRYRMALYYILIFVANTAISVCWYYFRDGGGSLIQALLGQPKNSALVDDSILSTETALVLVFAVICCFIIGIFFLEIYYCFLHPKASIVFSANTKTKLENEKQGNALIKNDLPLYVALHETSV